MKTLIFFIALFITVYAFTKILADLGNFLKDKDSKGYDMTFFLLSCVFWTIFYHLNN